MATKLIAPPLICRQISNDCWLFEVAFHPSEILPTPAVVMRFVGCAGTSPLAAAATSSSAETVAEFNNVVKEMSILPSVIVTGNALMMAVFVPASAAMS